MRPRVARWVAVLAAVASLGGAGQYAANAAPSPHGHHHQHRPGGGHHAVTPAEPSTTTDDLPLAVAALVAVGQLLALGRVLLAVDAVDNRRDRR